MPGPAWLLRPCKTGCAYQFYSVAVANLTLSVQSRHWTARATSHSGIPLQLFSGKHSLGQGHACTAGNAKEEIPSWFNYSGVPGQIFPTQFSNSSCLYYYDLRVLPRPLYGHSLENDRAEGQGASLFRPKASRGPSPTEFIPQRQDSALPRRTEQTVNVHLWSKGFWELPWVGALSTGGHAR